MSLARSLRTLRLHGALVTVLVCALRCDALRATDNASADCVTDYDASANVDYFPDKADVRYADTFSVEYFPAYKVVTVTNFTANYTFVLYQCGTPAPELTGQQVERYLPVPVTQVATGTPDHIPRIEVS